MSETMQRRVRPQGLASQYAPWRDRSGRVSLLKTTAFALAAVPGIWLAATWAAGMLGPRPIMAAIHSTGLFSIRFLLLSLLVTPLRTMFNWPRITQVRRLLGLAALAYAAAHLVLYADDQKWKLLTVVSEIALRFYLTIGFVALLGLAVLGVTSTDAWLRRLGARWKRLHRIAYGLGILAAFHFFLQSKADVSEASLMAGLLVWLMAWRALPAGPDRQPLPLLLLAGAAALGTVGIEFAWYALATRVPVSRVIAAESAIDWYGLQPGGQILVLGLCMALAVTLAWAQQQRRLQETAAFHMTLYLAGGLMAGAVAFAFGLDADSDAPAWIAPAIWAALLAMLGLARWRLPAERRGLLDVLVAGCLGYLLVSLGVDSHPAMLAASAALILSALAMSVRFWPISRASALLLLPTTLWIGYATAIMP